MTTAPSSDPSRTVQVYGAMRGFWQDARSYSTGAVAAVEFASVESGSNAELEAARRELHERYQRFAATRPFSWSRMNDQMEIARLKRRIAKLEREAATR